MKPYYYLMNIIVIACVLSACQSAANVAEVSVESMIEYIRSTGVDEEIVYVEEEALFTIGGDSIMSKEDVLARMNQDKGLDPQQRRYSYLINDRYVRSVRIYMDAKTVPYAWRAATRQAMAKYNAVSGSKLRFREVRDCRPLGGYARTCDTLINGGYSNGGFVGRAYFPFSNGMPGYNIFINTRYNNLSNANKVNTMLHEIGHTIGLYHTDQNVGAKIPGTPSFDGNSVMNSVINNKPNLSPYDVAAIRALYPNR